MKTSILALAITGALLSPALSADINGGSFKDGPVSSQATTVNWSGVYIGGALGYGNANHNLSLHDYFKDFCAYDAQAADPDFNPFEDDVDAPAGFPGGGTPARQWTFANVKKGIPGVTGVDCDTASHPSLVGLPGSPGLTPATTVQGDSREIASLDGVNSSGVTGDVRLGADMQRGRFVFGVFGSYGLSEMDTTVSLGGTTITAIEKGDEWSLGARAGLLVNPRTLAYIMAAYTESDWTFAGIGAGGGSKDVTFSGVTVGGGVEFAVTNNVFLGIEGTHTFYGEETLLDIYSANNNQGIRLNDEIGETKVMGTLKVKLNGGPAAILD